jgi:hypothetical protein
MRPTRYLEEGPKIEKNRIPKESQKMKMWQARFD